MQYADGTSPITYTVTGSITGRRVSMSPYSVKPLSGELSVTNNTPESTNIRTGKITSTNSSKSKMGVYYGERELARSDDEIAFAKVDLIVSQGPGTNGGSPLPEDRQPAGGTAPATNELNPGTFILLLPQDQTNRVATTLTLKGDPTGGSVTLDQHGLTDLKIYSDEALQEELTLPKTWTNGDTPPSTLYMVGSSSSTNLQSSQGTLDLTYKANLAADGGEYSVKDTVGVTLLPVEFKKIYEEHNPVNFVHDTTPKDDPPPLLRNILYTVIVPQSLDYHLKLEMEIPEAFRTKFMWAVVNNQNQTAGEGFFPADGPADVVFDHNASGWRGDYDVFVGYDANNNSVLDVSERTPITVPKLNQPLKIHGANSQAYAESNIAIATGGILGGYVAPIAEALLDIFFFGDASQVESGWQPTSTTTVSFSCFSGDWSDWLTHNAGAGFNASGDATIKLYTWDSSTQASNKLASAPAIKDNLLAMHGLKQSQIASALEGAAVGTEMSFPSDTGWYEFPLDRITFQEQLTHMDEYLAVARARISGFKVRFKAKKTSSGVDIIETVTTGVIEDLYDFNYIAGFLSQRAATIQLSHGNGSFGSGREAGQIYRNRFEFYKTWNGLP